jgi:glycerate 2-kinase
MIIENTEQLLSHGNRRGREVALAVLEHAIASVSAYAKVKSTVRIEKKRRSGRSREGDVEELVVGDRRYDVGKIGSIYVIGAGKATLSIAQALDEVLGDRIVDGAVIVKRGQGSQLRHIKVYEAGHPVPDRAGIEATEAILAIAERATKGDLVFCAISGGASALMPLPAEGISLGEKQTVTRLLLGCGATVEEMNCVRNHISSIKGGKLAGLIHPAEMLNLIVIDEVDGLPWGPTVPDNTSFGEAIDVLNAYGLWMKVPETVRRHLKAGLVDPSLETLKERDFAGFKTSNLILGDNVALCKAAQTKARELGFDSLILTTGVRGESSQVGIVLGTIAKEVESFGRPIKPPCVLIIGGETTVTLIGRHGSGGPSQELALSSSLIIDGSERIVIASIDTDGTDGPTDAAGGIVDGCELERARLAGVDLAKDLRAHNTHRALVELGDAIVTGLTGTNVMDLDIAVIT